MQPNDDGARSDRRPTPPPARAGGSGLRARTLRVVLTALAVELVAVLAVGNQKVAPHTASYAFDHSTTFLGRTAYSLLTFSWRFRALAADNQNFWLSQVLGLLMLFAMTALLVGLTVRGRVAFVRTFVTIWMAVVVAASFAGFMRRLVVDGLNQPGTGRFTNAVFNGPNSYDLVAGLLLGLLVGVIAGLVAAATQRVAGKAIDPAIGGGGIPSYGAFDGTGGDWAGGTNPAGEPARDAAPPQGPPPQGPPPQGPPPRDLDPAGRDVAGADSTTVLPRSGSDTWDRGDPRDAGTAGSDQTAVLPRAAGGAAPTPPPAEPGSAR